MYIVSALSPSNSLSVLPKVYQGYVDVFSEDKAIELPDHSLEDLAIEVESGK